MLRLFEDMQWYNEYENLLSINDSFDFALKTILNGIQGLQRGMER